MRHSEQGWISLIEASSTLRELKKRQREKNVSGSEQNEAKQYF